MRGKTGDRYLRPLSIGLLVAACSSLAACNQAESVNAIKRPVEEENKSYVKYIGSHSSEELAKQYKTSCYSGCVISIAPANAPIQKSDGTSICIGSKYEYNTVISIVFVRGEFYGAACRISKSDYDSIEAHQHWSRIYNEYLDQRGVLKNFKTWKIPEGYITTFEEIITNDGRVREYRLYVGSKEHPHYSQFTVAKN